LLPSLPQKASSSEENVPVAQSVQNVSDVTAGKKVGPAVTAKPKKTSQPTVAGECTFFPARNYLCVHHVHWNAQDEHRKRRNMFSPALVCVCVCVCLFVTTITKKIVDRFAPNFIHSFLGRKGRPSSCFVMISKGMWK